MEFTSGIYSASDVIYMAHFSKKELNLTHSYTNPNFLLALWKDLAELFEKHFEVLTKSIADLTNVTSVTGGTFWFSL